ncbi:MAG: DUF2169 domain-containing protein [Puniceicoccales bacterium]
MKIHNENPEFLTFGWIIDKPEPPAWTATFVVKATMPLLGGDIGKWVDEKPKPLEPTGPLSEGKGEATEPVQPGDFAPLKLNGEWLVKATAYPPEGQPAQAFTVSVRVGQQEKSLNVFGRRVWENSLLKKSISDVELIDSIPVRWSYAFGGPNYADNPVGLGYKGGALPHFEYPEHPVVHPSEKYVPAGFGPVGDAWSPRKGLRGSYRKAWLRTNWPWRPDDFDWGFYQEAPADQQIPGFFRGDESVALRNLHPEHREINTSLPGLGARVLLLRQDDPTDEPDYREVPLKLDTVFVDAEEELLLVTWRGTAPARTQKLKEVTRILVTTEPIAEPISGSELVRRLQAYHDEEAMAVPFPEAARAELDAAMAEVKASVAEAKESVAQSEKEMSKQMADAEAQANKEIDEAVEAQAAEHRDLIQDRVANPPRQLPADPLEDIANPTLDLQPQLQSHVPRLESLAADARDADSQAAAMQEEAAKIGPTIDAAGAAILKQIAIGQAKAFGESGMGPAYVEGEEPMILPGETLTRERVVEVLQAGGNLARADLSGLDLSGLDFAGHMLVYANLDQANLTGCTFFGAQLDGSSFNQSVCVETDFTESTVLRASFKGVDFTHAKLDRLNLNTTSFEECDFGGLALNGWRVQLSSFAKCGFAGTHFTDTEFLLCDFSRAIMDGVVMDHCNVPSCKFEGTSLKGASFVGAGIENIRTGPGTDFTETNFSKATGQAPIFNGALCEHTCFTEAELPMAAFTEATVRNCDFSRAILPRAVFSDAEITDTAMVYANLIRASFYQALVTRVDFAGANLYEAGFMDATLTDPDFAGASVRKTLIANFVHDKHPLAVEVILTGDSHGA